MKAPSYQMGLQIKMMGFVDSFVDTPDQNFDDVAFADIAMKLVEWDGIDNVLMVHFRLEPHFVGFAFWSQSAHSYFSISNPAF